MLCIQINWLHCKGKSNFEGYYTH
ncbi:hypothetical protein MXB_494 [Myxobolus squamalis]|nr:hypothetical protein MXB_494 [Myxobolus squamalis]